MSDNVYYGVWINWSRGKYNGSTITLSPRSAGFLVAFLAIFVSLTGGSLWRILSFVLHQSRTSRDPRDGIHYQQQAILRNTTTPGVASWQFLQLISPWSKLSRRPLWSSFPLVLLAIINLSAFFAAGILVAEVTRTTSFEVLVRSENCGYLTPSTAKTSLGMQTKILNDTVEAASYSRACYGGLSSALECNQYASQTLPYGTADEKTCPFADGMCLTKWPAFTLDTGNISSHYHLGINSKPADRITYRRRTSCAPLKDSGFITTFNYTDARNATIGNKLPGQEGDVIDFFNFGPMNHPDRPRDNFTFVYNRHTAIIGYGYSLNSVEYTSGYGNESWQPDKALLRNDSVISLMFLAANNIYYYGKVEDPIFQATSPIRSLMDNGKNITLYESDYYVNPLGCVDQHQFCNPVNRECTKLDSDLTAVRLAWHQLGFNEIQNATVSMISVYIPTSGISQPIFNRGSAALRAQEHLTGSISGPLPADQWKKEVEYWFTTALANLQKAAVENARGPTNVLDGMYVSRPNNTTSRQLCSSQKIMTPPGSGAISFSTLGVAIILGIGGLIILSHLILEYVLGYIVPTRSYRLVRWALDDKLQLQRLAFEGAEIGTWKAKPGAVPVTICQETFLMNIGGEKDHPIIYSVDEELQTTAPANEAAESLADDIADEEHTEVDIERHTSRSHSVIRN